MRTLFQLLLAVLLVGATASGSLADSDDARGEVETLVWDASTSGSPDVVSEYEPNEGGVDLKLELSSVAETGAVDLEVEVRDADDYGLGLDFDAAGRSIRSSTALTGLIHRLQHESLAHFAAATVHGRLTQHTDTAPDDVYGIDYALFEHRTEFQPKGASKLTLAVGYRQQERDGVIQSTAVSHCGSCHVVSQSRPIDESTTDLALEARVAWDRGHIGFSATTRELETGPESISLIFDDALHPELLLPLFDNRLSYDSAEGPQPIDRRPETTKEIYRIDGTFSNLGGFVLSAEGVASSTENELTGRASDYSGFVLSLARNFGSEWSMSWRGRSYTLDADDYFVDIVERLGVAGPQGGRLYSDIYGVDPDYLSRSALNRDVIESRLEFTKRLGKKQGRVRLFWEFEDIDREHFEVAVGETGSTTNIVGASWWARPAKGWKTNVMAQHGETSDPFMVVDGQFSTLISPGPLPNPFHPDAAQYYEFHAARIADTTASAASWDELKVRGSYTTGTTMLSGSYRWWDGENDEGDLTDWARSQQVASLSVWSSPAPTWEWHLAYSLSETEIDAPASIPLFDG